MRLVTSPSSFKSCYIAEVKESMGEPLKRKRTAKRKVKTPAHLRPFIKQALENLGPSATYREIQGEALRLYNEALSAEIDSYFGRFQLGSASLVKEIAEDEGIFYGAGDGQ